MFPITHPERHWACRVNDQLTWHGFRAILLQNELLQLVILPDKGSEIVQFLYKPLDIDFLWRAPNALRDQTHFVPSGGSQISSFFDRWSGAWFEVLPNGGPGCDYKGATLGFFAETINVPWQHQILEDEPEQVRIGFWLKTYRTPLLIQKTLTLRRNVPALFIEERVTNCGEEAVEYMWGHHPVVGAPFLDEQCRLSAPRSTVQVFHDEDGPDHRMGLHQTGEWPVIRDRDGNPLDLRTMPPKQTRSMDNCYLYGFEDGWFSIQNPRLDVGFGLAWDANVFRYLWLWQALGGGIGYPWYGRTYAVALEPWTSYPCSGLQAAVDNGTVSRLKPGESVDSYLTAVAFRGKQDVTHISRDGAVV